MREIVDHYFPPIGLLVKGGGEDFTDFNYWRDKPLDIVDFTDSESDEDDVIEEKLSRLDTTRTKGSVLSEDDAGDEMIDSYLSDPRLSLDESVPESVAGEEDLAASLILDDVDDGDDEYEADEDELADDVPMTPEPTPTNPSSSTPIRSRDPT